MVCQICERALREEVARLGEPCGCGNPLGLVRSAALHTDPLQSAIHALKYEGREEVAPSLARYLRAVVQEEPWPEILTSLDGIVPVPLHDERKKERGFNQAALLADGVASAAAVPVLEEAVLRVGATNSQVGLSSVERAENVKGKFLAAPEQVQGKALLLVDDVYTTGATMRECAAAMRMAGAGAVFGLALARPASNESAPSTAAPPMAVQATRP